MCVVSMVTDHYRDEWQKRVIPLTPGGITGIPNSIPWQIGTQGQFIPHAVPGITAEEIAEFRRLLARAREYDARNNEPSCEMKEKQDALIAVAKALGVKITIEELNG